VENVETRGGEKIREARGKKKIRKREKP